MNEVRRRRGVRPWVLAGAVVGLLLIGSVSYAYLQIYALSSELALLKEELSATSAMFATRTDSLATGISTLDQKADGLSSTLSATEQNFQQRVEAVQSQVGSVEQSVGKVTGTVTTLEKLSKTDPELLQKYSKVFFLNEHYAPERVLEIPRAYLYNEDKPAAIHANVWPHMKRMLDDAKAAGVTIYVQSAYRSFDEQKYLKSAYRTTYGAGTANQFSADQGYSEHQLGTTADFITSGLGGQLEGFEQTAAYTWMKNNAHTYGFTLSYPEGNEHYVFEPWHWRYVGVPLATKLHSSGKHFYDLDQREIDTYLVNIFE